MKNYKSSYCNKKNNAKKRGIPFTLTLDEFKKLKDTDVCQYTGLVLNDKNKGNKKDRTLERIDNTKGYITGNVITASDFANNLKSITECEYDTISMNHILKMCINVKIQQLKVKFHFFKQKLVSMYLNFVYINNNISI